MIFMDSLEQCMNSLTKEIIFLVTISTKISKYNDDATFLKNKLFIVLWKKPQVSHLYPWCETSNKTFITQIYKEQHINQFIKE